MELLKDEVALAATSAEEIRELTRRATDATYYADDLTEAQIAAIEHVVRISSETVWAASRNPQQHFVSAMLDGRLAGFVIATVHGDDDDHELDWIMVDPALHGSGIGSALLQAGVAWLGEDRPMWLNVIRHNERAISFYAKHGFAVDHEAETHHLIPHYIMRRN